MRKARRGSWPAGFRVSKTFAGTNSEKAPAYRIRPPAEVLSAYCADDQDNRDDEQQNVGE
jgi:hypothetical protein